MTSTNEATKEVVSKDITELALGLLNIGTMWARHGLTIGKSALETSAQTLQTTAGLLAKLSDYLDTEAPAAAAPATAAPADAPADAPAAEPKIVEAEGVAVDDKAPRA